jgi:hypothetical protein
VNFAVVFGASLWSGYALPACHPENGTTTATGRGSTYQARKPVQTKPATSIGAMIGLVDRALALNPSFARGWRVSGLLRIFAGQHDLAIEQLDTSMRLSPRERMGQNLVAMGSAYFFTRRFDQAASRLLLSIQDDPGYPGTYRCLAACYAHMGRLDDARAIVARLRAITSQVMPSHLPYRNPEDRDLFLSGLRVAAGEDA